MRIGCAVVGCGNFAQVMHLPNILKFSDYKLQVVADSDIELAKNCAINFQAKRFTSEYQSVLDDPDVELVIICTPHNLHASMSMDAVNAGKHVMVEKPMAMKIEELKPLLKAIRKSGVCFTVGYNRRYSQVSMKAKDLLAGRKHPIVMNYRMVNEIWRHAWALDPTIGGGRILAEGVHLLDFCVYIVGAEPVRVFAEGGALSHPEMPDTQDNAVITMKFTDNSIASITIGDLGNPKYPKERIEIFTDERTILIDNFKKLEAFGYDGDNNISLPEIDKGFEKSLEVLAQAIRGEGKPLVDEIDGATATLCAVKTIEAINTGNPQEIDVSAVI